MTNMIIKFEERNIKDITKLFKDEHNMILHENYYSINLNDIANGTHKHFVAIINDEIVGTSSITKFFHSNTNKIRVYHRSSWTKPEHRNKGIWFKLMQFKAEYMNKHNWCVDDTINFVAVSIGDNRYKNLGWKYYNNYKNNQIKKQIWYTHWKHYRYV